MVPPTMMSNEVYLVPLNDDGSPQIESGSKYMYIEFSSDNPITLRFCIEGTSGICRHGSLWVNVPEQGTDFQRESFREFK